MALEVNEVRNEINETAYSWNLPAFDLGLDHQVLVEQYFQCIGDNVSAAHRAPEAGGSWKSSMDRTYGRWATGNTLILHYL